MYSFFDSSICIAKITLFLCFFWYISTPVTGFYSQKGLRISRKCSDMKKMNERNSEPSLIGNPVNYYGSSNYREYYERTSAQKRIRQRILGGNLIIVEAQNKNISSDSSESKRQVKKKSRLNKQKQKIMESKILKYSRRRNKWEHALRIFVQLRLHEGFLPRQLVYLAALNACSKAGLWQTALAILQDFWTRTNNSPISPDMLQAAMKACTRGGQPERAAALLLAEMSKNVNPGPTAIATGMAIFSKLEDWDSVVCLGDYLETNGMETNLTARNQLLGANIAKGDHLSAIHHLRALSAAGYCTNMCAVDRWQQIHPAKEMTKEQS